MVAAGGDGARAGSSFSPNRSFLRDVRRCSSINTRRASDADKTGRGDGRGGGRRGGNIQAWPYAPLSWHVWGIMGWKKARGNARWPGFSYCGEAEISLLPWMRLLPRFGGSQERCRHSGRRFCKDLLPQHCLLEVGIPQEPPPGAVLDPSASRLRGPGTQPAFLGSSHLLQQPRFGVCIPGCPDTSSTCTRRVSLDGGCTQCFPSSRDIFLVVLSPPPEEPIHRSPDCNHCRAEPVR